MPEVLETHAPPRSETPNLTLQQIGVLSLLSEGNTAAQIARRLDLSSEEVKNTRNDLKAHYKTQSFSAVVNLAIKNGDINLESQLDTELADKLTEQDHRLIGFYALGGSNQQLQRATNTGSKVIEKYHDQLLEKVGAWSRPHMVSRAYELGIFVIDSGEAA